MNPIPLELLTLLSSSVLGSLSRLWGVNTEIKRLQHLIHLQSIHAQNLQIKNAREYQHPHFQWTRRTIALTATFFIIAFPKLISVFLPNLSVYIGYPEASQGFLFFSSAQTKIQWVHLKGLIITPLDTHILSAIIGLYFGGSLISKP